jgi:hypothetical protein
MQGKSGFIAPLGAVASAAGLGASALAPLKRSMRQPRKLPAGLRKKSAICRAGLCEKGAQREAEGAQKGAGFACFLAEASRCRFLRGLGAQARAPKGRFDGAALEEGASRALERKAQKIPLGQEALFLAAMPGLRSAPSALGAPSAACTEAMKAALEKIGQRGGEAPHIANGAGHGLARAAAGAAQRRKAQAAPFFRLHRVL